MSGQIVGLYDLIHQTGEDFVNSIETSVPVATLLHLRSEATSFLQKATTDLQLDQVDYLSTAGTGLCVLGSFPDISPDLQVVPAIQHAIETVLTMMEQRGSSEKNAPLDCSLVCGLTCLLRALDLSLPFFASADRQWFIGVLPGLVKQVRFLDEVFVEPLLLLMGKLIADTSDYHMGEKEAQQIYSIFFPTFVGLGSRDNFTPLSQSHSQLFWLIFHFLWPAVNRDPKKAELHTTRRWLVTDPKLADPLAEMLCKRVLKGPGKLKVRCALIWALSALLADGFKNDIMRSDADDLDQAMKKPLPGMPAAETQKLSYCLSGHYSHSPASQRKKLSQMVEILETSPPPTWEVYFLHPFPVRDSRRKLYWTACAAGALSIARQWPGLPVQPRTPNTNNTWGPVHLASALGHAELLEYLLKKGHSVNEIGATGQHALHLAAERGRSQTIQVLLKAGAPANPSDDIALRPLHLAARNNHLEAAKALLAAEADPDAKETDEWTPCASLLQSSAHFCLTALHSLHLACQEGHLDFAKLLLDHKAQIEVEEHNKWRPLHIAASNGHALICEALLKAGAVVDSLEHLKWTPLMLAAQDGRTEATELLLKYGAAVNARERDNRTSLMIAALGDHPKTAQVLLSHGAEIHAETTSRKVTALYYAARRGRNGLVQLLLDNGAIRDSPQASSITALVGDAISEGHVETVRLLLTGGAKLSDGLKSIPDVETLVGLILALPMIEDFVVPSIATFIRHGNIKVAPSLLANVISKAPHLRKLELAPVFQLDSDDTAVLEATLLRNFRLQSVTIGEGTEGSRNPRLKDFLQAWKARNALLRTCPTTRLSRHLLQAIASPTSRKDTELIVGLAVLKFPSALLKARCPLALEPAVTARLMNLPCSSHTSEALVRYIAGGEVFSAPTVAPELFCKSDDDIIDTVAVHRQLLAIAQVLQLSKLVEELTKTPPADGAAPWTEYLTDPSALADDLATLWKGGSMTDFTVEVPNPEDPTQVVAFPCHQFILAARWPFFHSVVRAGMKESREGKLLLPVAGEQFGVTPSCLEAMLEYFYTGRIEQFSNPSDCSFGLSVSDYWGLTDEGEAEVLHKPLLDKLKANAEQE